jgi:predicted PurR-regulated permease PerM
MTLLLRKILFVATVIMMLVAIVIIGFIVTAARGQITELPQNYTAAKSVTTLKKLDTQSLLEVDSFLRLLTENEHI